MCSPELAATPQVAQCSPHCELPPRLPALLGACDVPETVVRTTAHAHGQMPESTQGCGSELEEPLMYPPQMLLCEA